MTYPQQPPGGVPSYGTAPEPGAPGQPGGNTTSGNTMTCPKCRGTMRSYERNQVTLEQCETCRGIFLDFGELEALTRLEAQLAAPAPQPAQQQPVQSQYGQPQYSQQYGRPDHYGPGWGHRGKYHYRKGGLSRLFFSS